MLVDVHFGEMQGNYCVVTLRPLGSKEGARLLASKIVKGGVVDTGDYQIYGDSGEIIGRLTKEGDRWNYVSYDGIGNNTIQNGVSLSKPQRIGLQKLHRMKKAIYSANSARFYKDPTIDSRIRIYYIDDMKKKLDKSIEEKRLKDVPEGIIVMYDGRNAWLQSDRKLFKV